MAAGHSYNDIFNEIYNDNVKLWMIWECDIMNGMRMWYYEWYENVILWMVWECKIMNDMRM